MIASLRDVLGPALARAGLETASDAWRIADLWERAVGPAIAAHATPIALRRGELVVGVPQAVWRQELALLAPDVQRNLNLAIGREVVERIRLVGGNAPGPGGARVERRVPPSPPSSPAQATPEAGSWPGLHATPELHRALAGLARARAARLARESVARRGGR